MAAPAEMTSQNISGKFQMNKSLSDDSDPILQLQGVGWLTRKAIRLASIYLTVKHYKSDDGVEHIDIDQTLTGGIQGTTENRILDWVERENNDHIFGDVLSKSRRIPREEVERDWLKKDWLDASLDDGRIIYTTAKSDTPKSKTTWVSEQVWGFELVNGEKRYTRHVYFKGPKGEIVEIRLVYDYQGPL